MLISEQARNRLRIIKAIRHDGPVARTQLPGLTGLSAGTISAVTGDLVARGLLLEERDNAPRRGRPRTYLSINAGGGVVAGAVIEGVGVLAVYFVDLSGRLLHRHQSRLVPARTYTEMSQTITAALREAFAQSPFDPAGIDRIGLALPAVVDTRAGRVLYLATLPYEDFPFADAIAEALGIPVTIENDLAVMTRAEHWFGRAQELDSFTLVNFDLALGSASYVDGLPLTGANGISPDIGHSKIDWGPDARPCYCGGRGCATAYASMVGVVQASGLVLAAAFPALDELKRQFATLLDRAEAGDAEARLPLREAGRRLGQTIGNHVNAADPGNVLVLMPDERLHPLIAGDFRDALAEALMPGRIGTVNLRFVPVDSNWRWQGTAALALEQAFLSGDWTSQSRPR